MINKNVKLGENVRIGHGTIIEENCSIGDNTFIGHNCVLRPGTIIGKDCLIGHLTVFEGGTTVGDRCVIHSQCHVTKGITIENECWIGMMTIFTNNKNITHGRDIPLIYDYTVVHRAVRIGAGTILTAGVDIGENSFVGMGSLVTKDIPAKQLWFGNPAKYIRDIPEEEWL